VGITASQPQALLDRVQDLTQSYPSERLPDVRRLSLSLLLEGALNLSYLKNHATSNARVEKQFESPPSPYYGTFDDTTTYGIDRGFKDLDIGRNNDMNAITGSSPVDDEHLELVTGIGGFGDGHYYDKPVPINIPRILEPLPNKLLENPMNLLVSGFSSFLQLTLLTRF
jgi:hypothetical protein